MLRIFEVLFNGKKPVNVSESIHAKRVDPQRKRLRKELEKLDRATRKINVEAKKMKKTIDTALAIAVATGGLR